MDIQFHQLANGIRLVHSYDTATVGHCGFFVDAGSRDELDTELGMAHFIEHTLFKGTRRRRAYHILSRMEDVGGELNAYTTKEQTVVYASFYQNFFARALELMADIVFNSVFPEKELEKEKEVIIDEINSYKDSPSEQIYDDFEELLFPNHGLGRQILGTSESVRAFSAADIQRFMQRTYYTDRMVVAVVGKLPFAQARRLVERYFGHIPALTQGPQLRTQPTPLRFEQRRVYDTHQAHCILGTHAFDVYDERRTALSLLANYLGGSGMNARLNLTLRERHGIAYNIEAGFSPYTDAGLFNVYFGTDKENLDYSQELIDREFRAVKAKKLGVLQLSRAQKQFIGQIAISAESRENQMLSMGKSTLLYNQIDSLESIYQRIEQTTANELIELANELLMPERISTLIFE